MSGEQRPWFAPRSPLLDNLRPRPDRTATLARYSRVAGQYEGTTTRIRQVRQRAIDLLDLRPGETVFDVACGAGAILGALAWRVGPRGHVVGIKQSPEMAALARGAACDAPNVRVSCDPVESFTSPQPADALVFCYTHDVLQNPLALANLFGQARPGARVAVAGLCLLPWWGAPVNAWVLWGARNYLTTWHGLREPWSSPGPVRRQPLPPGHRVSRHGYRGQTMKFAWHTPALRLHRISGTPEFNVAIPGEVPVRETSRDTGAACT